MMELLLIAFMVSPVILAALIAVIGAAVALSRTRAEKPTHTETSVVIYIPAPHDPPRPVRTVIEEHHHYHITEQHFDNRQITLQGDQAPGKGHAVTVYTPKERPLLPPPAALPKRLQQRGRVFKVVGEREEW